MATYTTSDFKPGLKFMQDGEPCVIVENEFVKPGKGQAFTRTRIRKLISGKVLDVNFKSGTSVEAADVMDLNLTYSYKDDAFWGEGLRAAPKKQEKYTISLKPNTTLYAAAQVICVNSDRKPSLDLEGSKAK